VDDPRVAAALAKHDAALAGLLAAVADAVPSPRVSPVLLALADRQDVPHSGAWADLLARATVRHGEADMIPRLLERLTHWEGRESIRGALVALGDPAFVQIAAALEETSRPRRLRAQLPQTLGRFGTQAAAEQLLDRVERDPDGLVRYKALRALGRLVADYRIEVDRGRIERHVHANLVTYCSTTNFVSRSSAPFAC
jgi:HEAT repeat protein